MTIDPSIAKVQPGDDRALMDDVPPQNMLSFDLETAETAPDEYKGAAARRISESFGVPDPDGRMWRSDENPFQTGAEYLDYMRGLHRSGHIFEYSATPELKEFTKADAAGRLAIARKARGFGKAAADTISKAVIPEGYGLADNARELAGAPQEVLDANARMRADRETEERHAKTKLVSRITLDKSVMDGVAPYVPRPAAEDKADRAAVDSWRQQRDDAALIKEHHGKLMEKNVALVYLNLAPSLSDKGRVIAANAFRDRKLSGSDIADFQRLGEDEQAIIAKLARMARKPVEGTFFNTMGDAGIGFLNGILSTPANAARQLGTVSDTIDRTIFGKNSGLVDAEELNRRAREKQRLIEALDDPQGVNPSGAEHGYLARAIVGAASTLPYMAYASIPYVGAATVAMDFMTQVDDQVAAEGGDVYGQGPEAMAYKLFAGALYCGIEKVQALPVFGKGGDLAKKLMFVKLFSRHGAAAAEKLAVHIGKDTLAETLEESVQGIIQANATSVGLDKGPGWREAVNQGIREGVESLGTMGIISAVGAGRQAYSARSPTTKEFLKETAVNAGRKISFLLSDNPYAGRASEDEAKQATTGVHMERERYLADWTEGGTEALIRKHGMTGHQAAIMDRVFSAGTEEENNASFIEGRNIHMRTAGKGVAFVEDTPDSVRKLVAEAGPEAQAKLMERGYTESGAAKVASYYAEEAENQKRAESVIRDIAAKRAADWAQPDAVDARAREAADIAAELQPLRSIYQRAGTAENAVKAFEELKFTPGQAREMAEMFDNEHRLATSPKAAAAFRAAYLDTSEEETAADRLKRMTGFESEAAPEHGDGAARLTLKDSDGNVKGRILYLPDRTVDFNPEGRYAWEAVNDALPGLYTADEWQALTPERRRAVTEAHGIRAKGGFEVTDEFDPAIRADGAQADLLTGKLTLAPDAPSATLYHEAAHAWLAVMRRAGKLTAADIQKLQAAYGIAENDKGWFNEEKFADAIREIGAGRDYTPDQSLASRFIAAVRRFSGTARAEQAKARGSADALQSLFESVVYGRAFDGVGDLKALAAAKTATDAASDTAQAADPMAGAATAKAGDAPAAEETGTQKQTNRKKVKKTDTTSWTAATPQGNVRVGGRWVIAPRDRFISDTDPRYDFSLQQRKRDDTKGSTEQVAAISTPGVFDALLLMDAPNTANGAPVVVPVTLKNPDTGKDEEYYMVVSGNGRFRALDEVDKDNRGDEYRNPIKLFADEKNIPYKQDEMTAQSRPRLVRVITEKPDNTTLQEIARLSNLNAVLQMTDAEQASADAELIENDGMAAKFSANKDGLPSKTGNDEFFSWFIGATGDSSLRDSKGNTTAAARDRARRAMLAYIIGKGKTGKDTVMVFLEAAETLGLERQRDALLMSSGYLAALEENKPTYGLRETLSLATASFIELARIRKAGQNITADQHIGQGDLFDPIFNTQAELIRVLDLHRPAEGIAEVFRRYTDIVSAKNTETSDLFSDADAEKAELLKKAATDTEVDADTRYSLTAYTRDALKKVMAAPAIKADTARLPGGLDTMDPRTRRRALLDSGKAMRGTYTNTDTGGEIQVTRATLTEVLKHGPFDASGAEAYASIPVIIRNMIHVAEQDNTSKQNHPFITKFDYYLCWLDTSAGTRLVKAAVARLADGSTYYDHSLTEMTKDAFGASAGLVSNQGLVSDTSFDGLKDTRLAGILQARISEEQSKNVRYSIQAWNMEAPNGEPSNLSDEQWAMVRTDNFKKWFGDWENDPQNSSKAVDENGEPMVFYHGTGPTFWRFDSSKLGSREDMFFFSSNFRTARDYGDRVMAVFLNIRKPYEDGSLPKDEIISRGHDGFILDKDTEYNEWAVLHPAQIKSATDNNGKFSAKNSDIRYSLTANTYDDARRILEPLAGVELTNAENGLKASLSKKSVDKILSGKATLKSISVAAHLHAAANIKALFEDGRELITETGSKGEVKSSHKFFVAFPFEGRALIAKITVQEYKHSDDNRIYSVEALEVAKPEGNLTPEERGVLSSHDGRTPVSLEKRLLQMASEVNREISQETETEEAPQSPAIRYSIDTTGRTYDTKGDIIGFMAAAAYKGMPFPNKKSIALLAQGLGVDSYDYDQMSAQARELASNTTDSAIRKALESADPAKTAYAIGELSRRAARAYVRSGAIEGDRLARSADRIRVKTEAYTRKAIQLMTGADYASIETDTGIDIAQTILLSDPKKFNPQAETEKKQAADAADSTLPEDAEKPAETVDANPETDEDAPGLTDQQRAEIIRKRAEHEARIQAILDAAAKQGAKNRLSAEERRRKAKEAKEAEAGGDTAPGSGAGDAASGMTPETPSQEEEDFGPAIPADFTDRWDAAAFLRVWAFARFNRENPNHLTRDITKDSLAVGFYRKTDVQQLNELAHKLLEPGYRREIILLDIADISEGLTANQIERKTAYVFGRLNRYAVRDGTKKLMKQFKNEIKRQYIKGEKFEELGVDLSRTITGGVEEDARYVVKICDLSEKHAEGETSPLSQEKARVQAVIAGRMDMTDIDGNPVAVGDDDMQYRKALRQMMLLDQFGGMVDMMPGEILDLTGKALDAFGQVALALHQRWETYDKTVKSIRDPLSAAILARGIEAPHVEKTWLGEFVESLTGMLRLRLDNLTRFAAPEKRAPARAAIDDSIDLLAQGGRDHALAIQGDEAALVLALGKIFTRPDGRPDQRKIRAFLRRLDQKIPAELSAQLTRQQKQGLMTYGQMIQLLTSLEQAASFKQNILKHGREKQAALIRSFTYEDPKTGEIRKALTNEDALFVEWLRREFYPKKRGVLSVVFERLCGRPVDNPDPLYCPVAFLIQKVEGMADIAGSAWQAVDGVFSRRVSHTLDFDEEASVLDLFRDRSRKTALLTAYGERGLVLREVLVSRQFQDAVKALYGKKAGNKEIRKILEQVTQSLNGGKTRAENDRQTAALELADKVITYIGIGWNIQSAFKQTASLPVFANIYGFRKLFSMMATYDKEAVRRLKASDEYRLRYGTGPESGMDVATRDAYEDPDKSVWQKLFIDWGLFANRKADSIISMLAGQGIYRDLKAKYLDNGMDEATADRRAISETFSVIEETQQSGRTENTMALTRNNKLAKVFTKFATSPLQQMQYELVSFNEWRDLVANKGPQANIAEARNRFMRSLFINHVIVPGTMALIASAYKLATGDEPDWEKEGFWQKLLISAIMGQFSRIILVGAVTESVLGALFLREKPHMGQLIPAEGIIRFSATMAYPVRDIATWDMDHFHADIMRALKSTALTRLPTKLYENYVDEEKK